VFTLETEAEALMMHRLTILISIGTQTLGNQLSDWAKDVLP
jgi:hypothetical protein